MSYPSRLGATAVEILESIHQHRLLSTGQLHELHSPQATRRWIQLVAAELQRHELVAAVRRPNGTKLLYVTPDGADAVETIGSRAETRRKVVAPEQAAGPLQQHTLAVNDVGICFVRAASTTTNAARGRGATRSPTQSATSPANIRESTSSPTRC